MTVDSWETARLRGRTAIRVYVADTDLMGVVYNGNYLTWFEIGRTELLREGGASYAEIEARGYSLPVTQARFRVRHPARYDDKIDIETRVGGIRSREITFLYRVYCDGRLLVEGETTHVPQRHEGGATRIPDWLLGHLR